MDGQPGTTMISGKGYLLCRFGLDYIVNFTNSAYRAGFDLDDAHAVGFPVLERLPVEDRQIARDRIASLSADIPAITYHHRFIRPDGSAAWQEWTDQALFDVDGNIIAYQSIGRDIGGSAGIEEILVVQRDLIADLYGAESMEESFERIMTALMKIAPVDSGGIYIYERREGRIRLACHRGLSPGFIGEVEQYPAGSEQFAFVMRGDPVYAEYMSLVQLSPAKKAEGLKTLGVVPIRHEGSVIAALNIASHRADFFPDSVKAAVETIAGLIGNILHEIRYRHRISEQENNFLSLFNSIDDLMFVLDGKGDIIDSNAAVAKTLGYSPEELRGMSVIALHPEERRAEVVSIVDRMLRGIIIPCHVPLLARDGSHIPVETIIAHGIWNGEPAIFGISRNISERISLQKLLHESNERFEMALRGGNLGTWDWDIPTGRVVFNERWAEMLGYALDEIEPSVSSWEKLLHPDDRAEVMEILGEHLRGALPIYQSVHRLRTKTGSWKWVLDTGKVVDWSRDGEPVRAAGTHMDMTERIEAARRLEFREQFEQIIMILSTDFINLDSDEIDRGIERALSRIGSFLKADRAYLFLFSADGERMTNTHEWCADGIVPQIEQLRDLPVATFPWWVDRLRGWETIAVPDIAELPPEAVAERTILESQGIKSLVVVPIIHGDALLGFAGFDSVNEYRIWEREGVGLLRTMGELIANVIRRNRYEKEIRDARREAERANMAKTEFLANMSHEIRTPMNAILGISKLLQGKNADNLSQKQCEGLRLIHESGMRLLGLIDDLLDLAKIEAGKMTVRIAPFSITGLIDEVEGVARGLIAGKNIYIEKTVNAAIDSVWTDHDKVRQILINLVGNAAKYTETGHIEISAIAENGRLVCTVADTGIGIAEEYIPHLFEPFTQADISISKRYGGTGLGLALCKRFSNLLGGDIQVSRGPDSGTVVTFYVPLLPGDGSSSDAVVKTGDSRGDSAGGRATVLIVDDDESVRHSLRLMLEDDFDLMIASDGQTGIQLFQANRPDLVLLDIMMPGMNGFQVYDALHAIDPAMPIIAATARAMSYELERIRAYGFDACVTKPLDNDILYDPMMDMLHQSKRNAS